MARTDTTKISDGRWRVKVDTPPGLEVHAVKEGRDYLVKLAQVDDTGAIVGDTTFAEAPNLSAAVTAGQGWADHFDTPTAPASDPEPADDNVVADDDDDAADDGALVEGAATVVEADAARHAPPTPVMAAARPERSGRECWMWLDGDETIGWSVVRRYPHTHAKTILRVTGRRQQGDAALENAIAYESGQGVLVHAGRYPEG